MDLLFDDSAALSFLAHLQGQLSLEDVLAHPAYQVVAKHAARYGAPLTAADVRSALRGDPSPFYGLTSLEQNLPRIHNLLQSIKVSWPTWSNLVREALERIVPGEEKAITVHPILGYDMGIGLDDAVCLNLNSAQYLADPNEFLFFIIHECVHVLYERHHLLQPLSEITSAEDWRSSFTLWLQNEGFAVYAPLQLRSQMGLLGDRDYRCLEDPYAMDGAVQDFWSAWQKFQGADPLQRDEALHLCFGPKRLTYRVGCHLVRLIEQDYGLGEVQQAFRMDGITFLQKYRHLLEE